MLNGGASSTATDLSLLQGRQGCQWLLDPWASGRDPHPAHGLGAGEEGLQHSAEGTRVTHSPAMVEVEDEVRAWEEEEGRRGHQRALQCL